MKVYLSRIIIFNRAPFDKLDLSFAENGISVLTGINGQGKTTIMSYIVDSWYELIRNTFSNEFKGREGSYYRISTSLYVPDTLKPSIVYVRFIVNNTNVDYINLETTLTQVQYDEFVNLPGKIPFEILRGRDGKTRKGKFVSENLSNDLINDLFNYNVITSFPSFRYELPYYINSIFKERFEFRIDNYYSGSLKNPLEVISGMDGIANWLMDLVLDKELYDKDRSQRQETALWRNVVSVLNATLKSKLNGIPVRFAIGRRNSGASRISIVRQDNSTVVYPSIFGMSSGEMAILTLFVEIVRQADCLITNIPLSDIRGIVLIDEIDKHLHIKLQKEVLPSMLQLFPNLQFIITTHSPFLIMGIAEDTDLKLRTKIADLDQGGMLTEAESVEIYNEVYQMMLGENSNYKEMYEAILTKSKESDKPLIITEGKTDAKHIKNAMAKLGIADVDVEFFEINDNNWGDTMLETMLSNLSMLINKRKIIGIFDRDTEKYINLTIDATKPYREFKTDSNVYAFCIPLVNEEEYGPKISIEHYYHKKDLLKENAEKRRIFLGSEFYKSGNSKDGKYQAKIKEDKIQKNGVVDEKVYLAADLNHEHSVAMTKNDFADLVCGETDYADDFDFSNFNRIIDVLREIIS